MATKTPARTAKTENMLPAAAPSTSRRLNKFDRLHVQSVLAQPVMDYMDDPCFREHDAVQKLFDDAAPLPTPNCDWYHPGLDNEFDIRQAPAVNTLLNAAQEKAIFLQFNYARFRVARLQQRMIKDDWSDAQGAALLYWHDESIRLRDRIVEFNLALVLAMARHVSAAKLDFSELLSEGNMALLRAVDKFDVSRNFKFSTYACRAILKAYSRMSVKRARVRGLFPVSFDPSLEQPVEDAAARQREMVEYTSELRRVLGTNEVPLTKLERQVIACRFPMEDDRTCNPPTLQEVGRMVGYSKERIRQIQRQALDKLRDHMQSRFINIPFDQKQSA